MDIQRNANTLPMLIHTTRPPQVAAHLRPSSESPAKDHSNSSSSTHAHGKRIRLRPCVRALLALAICLASSVHVAPRIALAQAGATMGGNVVSSTMTGAILGAATMGLQDETQFTDPLRVGVGLGILGGIGLSVYDLIDTRGVSQPVRNGAFVTSNNTGTVLLVDTIYGAVAGGLIGTAIILVSNQPLVDGLQYGASTGAWMGFTFGLFDAFVLSNPSFLKPRSPFNPGGAVTAPRGKTASLAADPTGQHVADAVPTHGGRVHFNVLQPSTITMMNVEGATASRIVRPTLHVISLRIAL